LPIHIHKLSRCFFACIFFGIQDLWFIEVFCFSWFFLFKSKSSLKGDKAFLYFLHDEDKNTMNMWCLFFAEFLRFESWDYFSLNLRFLRWFSLLFYHCPFLLSQALDFFFDSLFEWSLQHFTWNKISFHIAQKTPTGLKQIIAKSE
jgi:hypothetical protein